MDAVLSMVMAAFVVGLLLGWGGGFLLGRTLTRIMTSRREMEREQFMMRLIRGSSR